MTPGATLDFTYSVRWEETKIPFRKRFDRYLDNSFFEHQVSFACAAGVPRSRITLTGCSSYTGMARSEC